MTVDEDKFEVDLDVQQFTPEEITVKISGDRTVIVEGKHEERQDEHGFVCRHFIRKYFLPKCYNIENVYSTLTSDGVLTVTAPRTESKDKRSIPVQRMDLPANSEEDNEEEIKVGKSNTEKSEDEEESQKR